MPTTIIILLSALVTACISGIFGMAGGLIFMGIIATLMGVAEAMVVHGIVQSFSNGSRSYFLKDDVRWDILANTALGALPVILVLAFVSFIPQKGWLFVMLGLLPFLLWLPEGMLQGRAEKPSHAILCGAMVTGLNLVAGVAGPALDFFYVKTTLSRQEIVATKAVTMLVAHLIKIVYFGIPLVLSLGLVTLPPLWVLVACLPLVIVGTYLGTRILHTLSDIGFRSYTRYLVTFIGCVYLSRGAVLLGWV